MSGVLFYNKCRIKTNVLTSIQLTEAEEKDVNFYDYDGFRLLSYTNAEALALTELPANPVVNENLTFDEWNWTLAAIKSQINNVGGVVNVGAIYHTTDEKTHITCNPTKTFPQAYICLTPTVSNAVTVNWGDGTTDTWTSTSQETKSHTYTGVTDSSVYDIAISCTSGTYGFTNYITGSQANNQNCVYTDIKLSNKVTSLEQTCFGNCFSLQSIIISNSVTTIGNTCFANCYYLQSITIPDNITSLYYCFSSCYYLKFAILSNNIVSIGVNCFANCYCLQSITIPNGVISLGNSCFSNCSSLQSINIPNSVTTLGDSCVVSNSCLKYVNIPSGITSVPTTFALNCSTLNSITIPSNITTLNTNCFYNCNSLKRIYMQPTTPPTLASTSAITDNSLLVIYVPTGTLSAYQSADNWSTYSSKMIEYNL